MLHDLTIDLPMIWGGIIALAVLMYVVLDGFDLGIGILFAITRNETDRDKMIASIAPIWDGNETWLVLGGGGLLAAFPAAYSILLPALYVPMMLMLFGLVFRGVAFEFRPNARQSRRILGFGILAWLRGRNTGTGYGSRCIYHRLSRNHRVVAGKQLRLSDGLQRDMRHRPGRGLCIARGLLAHSEDRRQAARTLLRAGLHARHRARGLSCDGQYLDAAGASARC